jgi:hypothetical protein
VNEEYGYIITGSSNKNGNQTIIQLFKFPYVASIIKKSINAGCQGGIDKKYLIEELPLAGTSKKSKSGPVPVKALVIKWTRIPVRNCA